MDRRKLYQELKSAVETAFYNINGRSPIITQDDGRYFVATNSKRFVKFNIGKDNSDDPIFLGIREDGDTRSVFNGEVRNVQDFLLVWNLTFPGN